MLVAGSVMGIVFTVCGVSLLYSVLWTELIAAAIVFIWFISSGTAIAKLTRKVTFDYYLLGIMVGLLSAYLARINFNIVKLVLGSVPESNLPGMLIAGHSPGILIFVIALIPTIVEETAFRGYILTALATDLDPWPAIIVSAAMFSIIHFSIPFLPFLFLMGLLLGYLRLRTGSLIPPMLAHFTHNLIFVFVNLG